MRRDDGKPPFLSILTSISTLPIYSDIQDAARSSKEGKRSSPGKSAFTGEGCVLHPCADVRFLAPHLTSEHHLPALRALETCIS